MKPLRTRIGKDIIAEFLPPVGEIQDAAIIFCDGMPSVPSKRHVLEYWSRRGYWVFHPRYRGAWESGGIFLDHDPTDDILEVVRTVRDGTLLQTRPRLTQESKPQIKQVIIIGASFGGAVALLSSLHPEVDKVVAISSVIDWSVELMSKIEPLSDLRTYIRNGFGEAYRFSDHDFDRLGRDIQFFNPIAHIGEYDPNKVFIMHAKDDIIVSYDAVIRFVEKVHCSHQILKSGGHLSSSLSTSLFKGRAIRRFISS